MILERRNENLVNVMGTSRINLSDIVDRAAEMATHWEDVRVSKGDEFPMQITPDCSLSFGTKFRRYEQNMTPKAFEQYCGTSGIPAGYIRKCFDSGKEELALSNCREWKPADTDYLIRVYDGVVEGILSKRYNIFGSDLVLDALQQAVTDDKFAGRYEANQIYLDPARLHIRFVDFNNPLKISDRSKVYPGFVVQSSDIGTSSLSIKFMLYRYACRNGLVYVKHGGVLFRRTHLGDFDSAGKDLFMHALDKMDGLTEIITNNINDAAGRKFTQDEFDLYLARARRELHLGKSGEESLRTICETSYDRSLWGLINGVTENAQKSNVLDRRVEAEIWAGNMLAKAV